MSDYWLGIDLGGTNLKFGLLDDKLRLVGTMQLPTPASEGFEGVVAQMVRGAGRLIGREGIEPKRVKAVGIGAPGPLKISEGIVVAMPNIPGMENAPLGERLGDELGMPAVLENDANAAALGEYLCGAGKGSGNMVLLTLGTGIGSGIIVEGKILHGSHEMGGEMGHTIIVPDGEQCNCGQKGCLERYCSATYMVMRARRRLEGGQIRSALSDIPGGISELTARDIHRACVNGDAFAREVWLEAIHYLAIGCVNICRILDPDKIVLGGGMTAAGDDLIVPLRESVACLHWSITPLRTAVEIASLGNDAGVIGSAGAAWQEFNRK